jgi:hypothetical protein
MIESAALIAPISPPLTGASSIEPPLSATVAASRSVATGEMLLMSITTPPGCSPARTPSDPVSTRSTSAGVGQHRDDDRRRLRDLGGRRGGGRAGATSSSTAPRLRLCTVR